MLGINFSPWAGNAGLPAGCPSVDYRSTRVSRMPDVAIVILNFNGQKLLEDCVASLRGLTVPAEIIIADNGSTDGSLDYLREQQASLRLLNLEKNWGFAEGYNRALAQVEHPWLVLLNNDATLAPDWLEQLLAVAREKPHAAILGGKLL